MELDKKLKNFGHQADLIGSLLHGGKISVKEAYKKIKSSWKEVKAEYKSEKTLGENK